MVSTATSVFDICSGDLGEAGEEVRERWRKLVTANESAVISESLLNAIVVEDGKGDGRFPDRYTSQPPFCDWDSSKQSVQHLYCWIDSRGQFSNCLQK